MIRVIMASVLFLVLGFGTDLQDPRLNDFENERVGKHTITPAVVKEYAKHTITPTVYYGEKNLV